MNTLGRHILVEYFGCPGEILNDVIFIEKTMIDAAREAGMTVINSSFHHFSPFGVSGVVVVQESHLAIHDWPEFGYAAVDIFTCGEGNPWVAYDYLKKAFKAKSGSAMEMLRGNKDVLERSEFSISEEQDGQGKINPKFQRNLWFTDRDDNQALSLRHKGDLLYQKKSDYQLVEVFDTYGYGKMLSIDKMVMTTEKDEFVYHEMITHPAMTINPSIQNVLIIGGGDGGTARELLRYPQIEQITMVEIDGAVIDACKEHLPNIASSFGHPKLNLIVGDGIAHVANAKAGEYDLVIVDGSDPKGPAEGLFSTEFFTNCYDALAENGICISQAESPYFNTQAFIDTFKLHKEIFGNQSAHCMLAHIPTYPSGTWAFSFATKGNQHPVNDLNIEHANTNAHNMGLKYYNGDLHRGAFALPNFIKSMIL